MDPILAVINSLIVYLMSCFRYHRDPIFSVVDSLIYLVSYFFVLFSVVIEQLLIASSTDVYGRNHRIFGESL
jgi:hypothetical protein